MLSIHNLCISLLSHPRPLELGPLHNQSSAPMYLEQIFSEWGNMCECKCSPIIDAPLSLSLRLTLIRFCPAWCSILTTVPILIVDLQTLLNFTGSSLPLFQIQVTQFWLLLFYLWCCSYEFCDVLISLGIFSEMLIVSAMSLWKS